MTQVNGSTSSSDSARDDVGAALMVRIRAGDRDAFTELVARYEKPVLNAVHRYMSNRAIAEELTQETFARVFGARMTYERKARFDTWLYRIVFNLCANAAEYGKRRRTLSLERSNGSANGVSREIPLDDPSGETPLQHMEKEELRQQVRSAIAALPHQQRAALIMSRYQGMPYQQIAQSLDTSVEAIKSLLFRARENLRKSLSAYLRAEAHDGR